MEKNSRWQVSRLLRYVFHLDHLLITLLAFAVVGVLAMATFHLDFLSPVKQALQNLSLTDLFYKVKNVGETAGTRQRVVAIVDMSELQSRADIGRLVGRVVDAGPRVVGVDVMFVGMKSDLEGNLVLDSAVAACADRVVWAEKLIDYDERSNHFQSRVRSYFTDMLEADEAYVNVEADLLHTVVRNCRSGMWLDEQADSAGGARLVPSLPCRLAQKYGADVEPVDQELLVDFSLMDVPVVKWNEVEQRRDELKDRVVLIGAVEDEGDMFVTPLGKTPGVEMHAYALMTLLNHGHVTYAPRWVSWLAAFVLCYLLELAMDVTYRLMRRRRSAVVDTLTDEAEKLVALVGILLATVAMHVVFEAQSVYLNAVLVLAVVAVVVECRHPYMAVMQVLAVKRPHWWLVRHSLFFEDEK